MPTRYVQLVTAKRWNASNVSFFAFASSRPTNVRLPAGAAAPFSALAGSGVSLLSSAPSPVSAGFASDDAAAPPPELGKKSFLFWWEGGGARGSFAGSVEQQSTTTHATRDRGKQADERPTCSSLRRSSLIFSSTLSVCL